MAYDADNFSLVGCLPLGFIRMHYVLLPVTGNQESGLFRWKRLGECQLKLQPPELYG